jgi:hypothetical protein
MAEEYPALKNGRILYAGAEEFEPIQIFYQPFDTPLVAIPSSREPHYVPKYAHRILDSISICPAPKTCAPSIL